MDQADSEWFRRAAAAGLDMERSSGQWVVFDVHGKTLGRFARRYEAESFISKRIGRELADVEKRIGAAADRLFREWVAQLDGHSKRRARRPPEDRPPAWAGSLPLHPGHAVYRAPTPEGRVLYVGVTSNLWGRLGTHAVAAPWRFDAVEIDWALYPTRAAAEMAEGRAIARHRPPHNVVGNGVHL